MHIVNTLFPALSNTPFTESAVKSPFMGETQGKRLLREIEALRCELGITKVEMARRLGLRSKQTYTNWMRRGDLSKEGMDAAQRVLDKARRDIEWSGASPVVAATAQELADGMHPGAAAVPVASVKLAAGHGGFEVQIEPDAFAGAQFYSKAWIRSRKLKPDRLLRIEVRGASMEPLLHDGDYVTINLDSRKPKPRRVYAVMLDGQPAVKRLVKRAGTWWISSDNPEYSPHDCEMMDEGQLIGEAVDRTSTYF